MKWAPDGETQMMEDAHRGEQAKESDTITKADCWLMIDDKLGGR